MNKLTAVEADLTRARDALTALQAELPQFHALLTENEQDAQRLKSERASLDAQAQARGRVQIAREMLEQHQSDIQTARAEAARLEAAQGREASLAEMIRQAELTAQHKATLDAQLARAGKGLEGYVQRCLEAHDSLIGAHQAFECVGADDDLTREFQERGLRLAEGPGPLKPYRFPEPYGGLVWGLVFQEIVKRAEATRGERLGQEAEARRKRRELEHPPEPELAELHVDQRDARAAAFRLGDLVRKVELVDNGMLRRPDEAVFRILPDKLEQAQELLRGVLTFGDVTVRRPRA